MTRYYAETRCPHGLLEMHQLPGEHVVFGCFGGTRTELVAPAEMDNPALAWIDCDVSVWREQGDGYVSVDGDAYLALADYLTEEDR